MTATDMGKVSDGYHSFNELYEHRHLLFINLTIAYPEISFKTWLNHKKEKMDGWFILGMETDHGEITYHVPDKYWKITTVKEIEYNSEYDGHDSEDVLERLKMFNRHVSFGELLPNR